MDNRNRDKMSQSKSGSMAGDLNRETSAREGKNRSSSGVEFGQKIGRSESQESGVSSESTRKSGSEWNESSGRGSSNSEGRH